VFVVCIFVIGRIHSSMLRDEGPKRALRPIGRKSRVRRDRLPTA
jgi:hypothetical protein